MKREERQVKILELLNTTEPIQNKDLMERFHVTDMTIRRDLNELAAQGKLIRTHGGAILAGGETGVETVPVPETIAVPNNPRVFPAPPGFIRTDPAPSLEPAYLSRAGKHAPQKQCIARMCLSLMEHKKYVYLDSGSSTYYIAQCAVTDLGCIFLTNGINIASALLQKEYPSVIAIGGEVRLNTWATRGTLTENQIRAFHADVAFLGCNAISPEGNVMIGNMTETGVKQAIMDISNELYLVADSSKFDTYSLTSYASIGDFDGIVTDSRLSADIRRKLEDMGAKMILAEMP